MSMILLETQCFTQVIHQMLQVKDAFKRIDINGDGKLTKREMLAGEEFTVEEVRISVVKRRHSYSSSIVRLLYPEQERYNRNH